MRAPPRPTVRPILLVVLVLAASPAWAATVEIGPGSGGPASVASVLGLSVALLHRKRRLRVRSEVPQSWTGSSSR